MAITETSEINFVLYTNEDFFMQSNIQLKFEHENLFNKTFTMFKYILLTIFRQKRYLKVCKYLKIVIRINFLFYSSIFSLSAISGGKKLTK